MPNPVIKQAYINSITYDLHAYGLVNGNTTYLTQDILDLINQAANAGFEPVIVPAGDDLPTANATNYENAKGKIYFKAESVGDGANNSYDEYIMVKGGTESAPTYAWEVVGHTGMELNGIKTVASSTTTAAPDKDYTGASSAEYSGSAGSATINGSNFTFTGTTATITVPAHSHTMGGTTKYLASVTAPKTFSTTSVITTLATTSIVSAGAATTVVTGYDDPETTSVATGVSGTTTRYKTASITGTNGTVTVATKGTAVTVVTSAISGYASPSKAGLATTSIYPAANITALTTVTSSTTSIYPAANVTAITSVTSSTATLASRVGSNVMNGATVSSDGVLSFNSTAVSGNVVSSVTTAGQSVRDTAATVVNAVTVPAGKSVRDSAATVATGGTTTGTAFITDLGTATAAATTSVTPVGGTTTAAQAASSAVTVITNGATTSTSGSVAFITDVAASGTTNAITALGAASTESVAKAGSEVTVVTGANGTTNAYTGIASSVAAASITTSSSGSTPFISTLNANTGEKAKEEISYQPTGTLGGSQSVAAHSHTIAHTHSLSGHKHSVTIPALDISLPASN